MFHVSTYIPYTTCDAQQVCTVSSICFRALSRGISLYGLLLSCARSYCSHPSVVNQVERKRHLGNDVVLVIFRDAGNTSISPEQINSQFNRILLIIFTLMNHSVFVICTVLCKLISPQPYSSDVFCVVQPEGNRYR